MLFCFDLDFLFLMSNFDHFACLSFTLIIWWLRLMIWFWSFWGLFLVWLNVLHVKYWLLFWSFDLLLNLVFELVVCTHTNCALCFRFEHLALMVGLVSLCEMPIPLITNSYCLVGQLMWWTHLSACTYDLHCVDIG